MDKFTQFCNDAAPDLWKRDLPQELHNALQEVKESMEGKRELTTWEELSEELQSPGRIES